MSVRPFICPFIHPPLEAPWRLAIKRLAQVFSVLSLVLSGLGQLLRGQGQPLRNLGARLRTLKSLSQPLNSPGQPPRGLQGGMDVRTDGWMDVRIYRFPPHSTGLRPLRSPPGPLPKKKDESPESFHCTLRKMTMKSMYSVPGHLLICLLICSQSSLIFLSPHCSLCLLTRSQAHGKENDVYKSNVSISYGFNQ